MSGSLLSVAVGMAQKRDQFVLFFPNSTVRDLDGGISGILDHKT